MVKCGVEHADDFTALVVHNTLLLLVVEGGDSETALVVLVVLKVDASQMSKAFVERIGSCVFAWYIFVWFGKSPS